eukprot:TRINITY_DN7779_c0_g1_i1.p1 TRINITY_DN7779_c0_g1~~TRINITY_DN7779_c0_g1_i1.p1  ORF type:complete len:309 (-),score=50.53 TRINITY_DN7779_c0_g1_i1:28-933(-)
MGNLSHSKIEKLFSDNPKPLSDLEKLPKNVLSNILYYLPPKDLAIVWRLNKYFLNILSESNSATLIWKNLCKIYLDKIEIDLEMEDFIQSLKKTEFEKKLNKYCLYFKHGGRLIWNVDKKGNNIQLKDDLTLQTGNAFSGSWNVCLGNKKFTKGIHFVEILTIKMDTSHFLFFGVGLESIDLNNCCFEKNGDSFVGGYDSRGPNVIEKGNNPRWEAGKRSAFILDLQTEKQPRLGFLVEGNWNGWRFDIKPKKNSSYEFYLMVCMAHHITVKINKYCQSIHSINNYINSTYNNNFDLILHL